MDTLAKSRGQEPEVAFWAGVQAGVGTPAAFLGLLHSVKTQAQAA